MKDKELGKKGEQLAAKYLENSCGYTLIKQNFTTKIGEIDIIAQDHGTIVFIEVKTRMTIRYGVPSEAVNKRKQQKIGKVAACFLCQQKRWQHPCRFDVIEVYAKNDNSIKINHIKNAFIL